MIAAAAGRSVALVASVVVSLNGTTIAPELVIADVAIRSGRSRADDSLSASSATIELLSPDPAGVSVAIADVLAVVVDGYPRFSGRVSEITRATTDLDDPEASTYTLVAVGPIARLSRALVPMPRPAETAAARITAVFAVAGIAVVVEGGTAYQLAEYGAVGDPPAAADQVIAGVVNDTGVVVADLGDGSVLAQFLDSRLSEDIYQPDPERTHVELSWEQTDDLVNEAHVSWPGGPDATATNPASITKYDRHAVGLATNLGSQAAAQERAAGIVARLASPAWQLAMVETWDAGIMDYRVGAIITVAPLPASSPVSGSAWQGVLEGWTEVYGPDAAGQLAGTWRLALSERAHSAETVTWANVSPAALQWAQVTPTTSWAEAVSNGDLSNLP